MIENLLSQLSPLVRVTMRCGFLDELAPRGDSSTALLTFLDPGQSMNNYDGIVSFLVRLQKLTILV